MEDVPENEDSEDPEQKFAKQISDSKKQEIKRMIGFAVLNHLKMRTIRIILLKEPGERSSWENRQLIAILKGQECLRSLRKLKDTGLRQLIDFMEYKNV